MSIKSCMVLDKSGRIIVARQFCPVSKLTLEEWARNMPRLICKRQQHTFLEDGELRYVYQRVEDLYLALVCSKDSNMIEDMEVLKTIHKVATELLDNQSFSEAAVEKNAVDLLLAFDDIVLNGLRTSCTAQQILVNIQMDSAEEKLHNMLMKARQEEAKEQARKY